MLECAFLKCAFLLMPFFSQSQGGHPRISLFRADCEARSGWQLHRRLQSLWTFITKHGGTSTTAWLRLRLLFSRFVSRHPSVSLFLLYVQQQLLHNCLLHWAVQNMGAAEGTTAASCLESGIWVPLCAPVSWPHPLLLGLMMRQPNLFHAGAWDIPTLWASPAISPSGSWCFSLSQPADRQEAVLCRSLLFYAASHCTGLETASRAKEGGQRHQHLLHICATAQFSATGEAEAKRPNEAAKNGYTPDIKGMPSFHLLSS